MPLPMANIDEATPVGFKPVDPAVYNATITDYDMKTTTDENGKLPVGTEYVQFTVELTDEGVAGRTLRQSVFPTSEKAKPKTKEFLIAMGLSSEDITGMSEFEPGDYVSVACKVQVGLTKPNEDGTRYNNIQRFLPLDDESAELPQ